MKSQTTVGGVGIRDIPTVDFGVRIFQSCDSLTSPAIPPSLPRAHIEDHM
jgi:hypothetical protein